MGRGLINGERAARAYNGGLGAAPPEADDILLKKYIGLYKFRRKSVNKIDNRVYQKPHYFRCLRLAILTALYCAYIKIIIKRDVIVLNKR